MQKYKKNTTLPNKSHSPVRLLLRRGGVLWRGGSRAARCGLRFGAAERSPRWGSVARWKPSGAGAPDVVRRSEASRRFRPICKRLYISKIKIFMLFSIKKLQKYLVSSQKMPNFALAFGNEATKIEKMTKIQIFFTKNLVN